MPAIAGAYPLVGNVSNISKLPKVIFCDCLLGTRSLFFVQPTYSVADSLNTFLDDTAYFLDLTMGSLTTDLNQAFAPKKVHGDSCDSAKWKKCPVYRQASLIVLRVHLHECLTR